MSSDVYWKTFDVFDQFYPDEFGTKLADVDIDSCTIFSEVITPMLYVAT